MLEHFVAPDCTAGQEGGELVQKLFVRRGILAMVCGHCVTRQAHPETAPLSVVSICGLSLLAERERTRCHEAVASSIIGMLR